VAEHGYLGDLNGYLADYLHRVACAARRVTTAQKPYARQSRSGGSGLGAFFCLVIGCGLMALMFFSSRSGRDEAATLKFMKRREETTSKSDVIR